VHLARIDLTEDALRKPIETVLIALVWLRRLENGANDEDDFGTAEEVRLYLAVRNKAFFSIPILVRACSGGGPKR